MHNSTTHGSVRLGLPSLEIFKFPSQPHKVAPHLRAPPSNMHEPKIFYFFDITPDIFHTVVDLRFVLTFILAYVTTVLFLNQYNASRQYRPWAISKSSFFKAFVFVHNSMLAIFSAWVIIGIIHGVIAHGPRVEQHNFYASMVEFMCQSDTAAFQLSTDAKSFVDQGAMYFGCVFYLSKYYEVIDTLIILMKGKKSSTLQTYHHAGVILCGWSAVTYESPVGFVGVALNAVVHTLMYSYFALQTIGIQVSMNIKRSLTGIQIAQFLVGMVWSLAYLFVGYTVPSSEAKKPVGNPLTPAIGSHASYVNSSVGSSDTMIPCLSDSGEATPLFMTNLYVLPLIYLFVQFFTRSYRKEKKVI
ncbi:uncharacterized protein N7484_009600 [Penicillium longicatenatum]|uniref:uncharacterized protein n=1 Tax=Penicillium longicatenatum TaxID=1561947 RepID=UPI0025467B47|nr:uncharacterized protein N7484_009600 [Penicillium longicatenatum]KAJ5636287.1 hypothetical protein N7484_009600 [Penicillium longicatenatum]